MAKWIVTLEIDEFNGDLRTAKDVRESLDVSLDSGEVEGDYETEILGVVNVEDWPMDTPTRPPIEAILARLDRYDKGLAKGQLKVADAICSSDEERSVCDYAIELEKRAKALLAAHDDEAPCENCKGTGQRLAEGREK